MRPLVTDHPRLYFTKADLPRLQAAKYADDKLLAMSQFTVGYFGGKQVVFDLPPRQPGKIDEPPGFDAKQEDEHAGGHMMSFRRRLQASLDHRLIGFRRSDEWSRVLFRHSGEGRNPGRNL